MAKQVKLTPEQLGALLEDAAQRGIESGKRGTDAPLTAAGIAGHVYLESGLHSIEENE